MTGGLAPLPRDYAHAGVEPLLEEVLHDPIVRAVMRRDGVEPRELAAVIAGARRRLFPPAAAPHGSSPGQRVTTGE